MHILQHQGTILLLPLDRLLSILLAQKSRLLSIKAHRSKHTSLKKVPIKVRMHSYQRNALRKLSALHMMDLSGLVAFHKQASTFLQVFGLWAADLFQEEPGPTKRMQSNKPQKAICKLCRAPRPNTRLQKRKTNSRQKANPSFKNLEQLERTSKQPHWLSLGQMLQAGW